MEFLLFLIFFSILTGIVAMLHYYITLFSDMEKDSFTRDELIDFLSIVPKQILSLLEKDEDAASAGIAFFISAFFSFLWSLLGGLVGSPHYTNEFGNYFFLSFFLLAILMTTFQSIKEAVLGDLLFTNPQHFLVKLFQQETAVLLGCGLALGASNLAVYGMYHQVLFVFVLPNVLILIGLMLYKLSGRSVGRAHIPIPGRFRKNDNLQKSEED